MKLNIASRSLEGKSHCKRLRNQGHVPAVLYGKNINNISLSVECRDLHPSLMGQVLELCYGGTVSKAMIKDVQVDPVKGFVIHIDFIAVTDDMPISMNVGCKFLNADLSPGIKYGGVLNLVIKKIPLVGLGANLPAAIEIDIASMNIGDSVKASDLKLPEGVALAKLRPNDIVANIVGRKAAAAAAKEDEQKK